MLFNCPLFVEGTLKGIWKPTCDPVGAVNDVLNYTGPGSVGMSSFSSWGPTDDGRIKPDVVGNGVGLFSSIALGVNLLLLVAVVGSVVMAKKRI